MNAFNQVRIVLIGTTHPGNIGAAARAMKNMYLSRLYLVAPERYPSAEATSRASGADDILAGAVVCDTLEEALAGVSMVCGASARLRRVEWAQVDARECGERVAAHAIGEGEVALVFGREHSGLTNAELERCNYLVHIPSNPDYSSLNLGAAVQVLTYEVAMAMGAGREKAAPRERPVTADELERMYAHLEQTLVDIDFLDPDNPGQLMRRLRRLFNRCNLEQTEVNILRGIFTAARKQARS